MNNGYMPIEPISVSVAMAMQGILASDINANMHQTDCVECAVFHADSLLKALNHDGSDK